MAGWVKSWHDLQHDAYWWIGGDVGILVPSNQNPNRANYQILKQTRIETPRTREKLRVMAELGIKQQVPEKPPFLMSYIEQLGDA